MAGWPTGRRAFAGEPVSQTGPRHRHRDSRHAGRLTRIVVHLDLPHLRGADDVDRARGADDPAAAGALEVVGVDVQPDAAVALGSSLLGAAGAQGLGKHHGHAAMQQALGLPHAHVHRYAATGDAVTDLKELHAKVVDHGADVAGGENVDREGSFSRQAWVCSGCLVAPTMGNIAADARA